MKKVSDPPDDPFSMSMRRRSGQINSQDLFVGFMYLLMRDHITPGTVEYMMIQLEKERWHIEPVDEVEFTNGWLAKYAEDVVGRLRGDIPLEKKPRPVLITELEDKTCYLTLPELEDF